MRGFVFSIDMVFGALLIIFLLGILVTTIQPTETALRVSTSILAKDATMEWLYSGVPSTPPLPMDSIFACELGFRPRVTTDLLNPSNPDDWETATNCVVKP